MNKVGTILLIVVIVAVALLLLAAVSGLLVWAASGMGWILLNWLRLPFTPFEATLLSLAAFVVVIWSAWRLLATVITLPLSSRGDQDVDEYEDEDDWDEDGEDEDEDELEEAALIPSIPKWRQPIRRAGSSVPVVGPDERCPCGSGRKYKNCHGRKS